MTCVVGMFKDHKVYLGADSASISGWDSLDRLDGKIFQKGELLIAFTSSFRMGQLIRYKFNPPECPKKMDDHEYMCTLFVDELRKTLSNGGFAKKENGVESAGSFLIAYHSKLFQIDDDYQVIRVDSFTADGCGRMPALGAMFAASELGLEPREILEMGLRAAVKYNIGVKQPFTIFCDCED